MTEDEYKKALAERDKLIDDMLEHWHFWDWSGASEFEARAEAMRGRK